MDPYLIVVRECLGVKAGEQVVVVTDPTKRAIAEALVGRCRELDAECILVEMTERERHGSEPPDAVAEIMAAGDVVIAPTEKSLSHTAARKRASENGVRIATMPQITEDMLERTMSADYTGIRRRSRAIADLLTTTDHVRVTAPGGTDATFEVTGRAGLSDDGDLSAPGAFGNLPAGEGFVAPLEGKTNGVVAFDGSIWPLGLLDEPLVARIEDGYAVALEGARAAEFRATLEAAGPEAFAVAELGIGTNDAARLTGNVLEDEKIMGTIHVAFGDNHSFGGTIRVSSHQDGIVRDPTVELNGKRILEGGCLLV